MCLFACVCCLCVCVSFLSACVALGRSSGPAEGSSSKNPLPCRHGSQLPFYRETLFPQATTTMSGLATATTQQLTLPPPIPLAPYHLSNSLHPPSLSCYTAGRGQRGGLRLPCSHTETQTSISPRFRLAAAAELARIQISLSSHIQYMLFMLLQCSTGQAMILNVIFTYFHGGFQFDGV